MTEFVYRNPPASDFGALRSAAPAAAPSRPLRGRAYEGRGLAALLLAAMVAALMVVAEHLISTWNDGGLLVAWVALWVVAFAALALGANSSRALATRFTRRWRTGALRRAQARSDARLLQAANADPRIMAELQAALSRAGDGSDASVAAAPAAAADAALAAWMTPYRPLFGLGADAAGRRPARPAGNGPAQYAPMYDWRLATRA